MSLITALFGGIISFISPCVLPLVPMYIAYISGVSVNELKGESKPVFKVFLHSVAFVIGFTIVFSLLAMLFYVFVSSLGNAKIWFNRIAGVIIVIFGFHLMGVITIPFLNYQVKYQAKTKKAGIWSSFVMGLAFGAGWTPCIGPILGGILGVAANSPHIIDSILLLVVYSLGLGIPFILTGIATERLLNVFNVIKKHYKLIEIVSGAFLIVLGTILFFDQMGAISGWIVKIFPALGNI